MRHEVFVVYLFLDMLTLIGWDRIPHKKSGDMLCQSIVDVCVILQKFFVLFVISDWGSVVVEILNVLMI